MSNVKLDKNGLTVPSIKVNENVLTINDEGNLTWNGLDLINGSSEALPVGTIIPFGGSSTPDGYLLCDGSKISRTIYSKLFQAIGTTWGAGDGSSTFTLPNLNGRFIEGYTTAGTYKDAGLPNITGNASARECDNADKIIKWKTYTGVFSGSTSTEGKFAFYSAGDSSGVGTLNFNASKSNAIYGKSSTVQPKSATVLYIIKYQ